ncbi:MAG: HEAT repeat domain-containing protein [Candidatus Eisenbacteria sp.]|nr:HEAT repeat domain-containing protein [Candidatus Eisenbacteria bacterium]
MRTSCTVLLLLLHCVSTAGPAASQEVAVEVATELAESDTAVLAELTPVELFLRASSSALQFEHMREPSRRILVSNHEESLPYLVTRLDTDDARERHALEDILVRIGPAAAEPVIEAFLFEAGRTETTRGARLAAAVLGRIGETCAVDPLASVHDHRDWKLRGAVGGALGRIGTAETVHPLVSLLTDENEVVRKSAAVGLRRVAVRARDDEAPDPDAAAALDTDVIESLARALGDPNYAVRYSSADALARIGETALPLLFEIGEGEAIEARLMALRAIGKVGSRKALEPLARALRDSDWAVRAHAAAAIGTIGADRRGRRALERLVASDPHPFVVASAAAALDSEDR